MPIVESGLHDATIALTIDDESKRYEEMTLDECLKHLRAISNMQKTYTQDQAVKFAIAVLEALRT
jgi:hypothetical protein